jgi:hypothetical protein
MLSIKMDAIVLVATFKWVSTLFFFFFCGALTLHDPDELCHV